MRRRNAVRAPVSTHTVVSNKYVREGLATDTVLASTPAFKSKMLKADGFELNLTYELKLNCAVK